MFATGETVSLTEWIIDAKLLSHWFCEIWGWIKVFDFHSAQRASLLSGGNCILKTKFVKLQLKGFRCQLFNFLICVRTQTNQNQSRGRRQ